MLRLILSSIVPLVNVATHTATWPTFARMMCERFGYAKIVSMVSGTDAMETACKIARKWGITRKGIHRDDVMIFSFSNCYHGHSASMWAFQDDSAIKEAYGFGDKHLMNFDPETKQVFTYGDTDRITQSIERHHAKLAAVVIECIRGDLA